VFWVNIQRYGGGTTKNRKNDKNFDFSTFFSSIFSISFHYSIYLSFSFEYSFWPWALTVHLLSVLQEHIVVGSECLLENCHLQLYVLAKQTINALLKLMVKMNTRNWIKGRLNSEKIWKIWKKRKLNSEMIVTLRFEKDHLSGASFMLCCRWNRR
jgi:hypothetical protein